MRSAERINSHRYGFGWCQRSDSNEELMAYWIILHGPKGVRRVLEGEPFRMDPGERVVRSEPSENELELDLALAEEQMELGDFVEAAIKLLPDSIRPTHCSACEKRKLAMNAWSKQGRAFVKRVKESLVG